MGPIDATSQHLQALLEASGDGIYGITRDGRCTFVNRVAVDLFGYSQEEMVGKDMHTLVHQHPSMEQDEPGVQQAMTAMLEGDGVFHEQLKTLFRKGGGSFVAEVSAEPVRVEGQVLGVVFSVRDMTERHAERALWTAERVLLTQAHEELSRRTAELETVLESVPQAVYVAEGIDGPVRSNSHADKLSGEVFPPQLATLDVARKGETTVALVEDSGRWLRSEARPILRGGDVIGAVAVNSDVTEGRLQEEALRRSEKLAGLGQLASTIAHEINDPLESIMNLLYLIRSGGSVDMTQEYALMAESELLRVSEITMQILRFYRPQRQPAPVHLEELTRTALSVYSGRMLVRNVQLFWRVRPVPPVLTMAGELRQVISNLVRNSIEAMPNGGTISIRINPQRGYDPASKSTRDGVRLTVADTGEGIAPKIADKLFQPFQTTKEQSGTGIGLWVSMGIIKKQGGRIRMRTSRDAQRHGTAFAIWLPTGPPTNGSQVDGAVSP